MIPLPYLTSEALAATYHARGVSARVFASSIGTTHPHANAVGAGRSRPSKILATRVAVALELPDEFMATMVVQSADKGQKMRFGDKHTGTVPVGHSPCPVDLARIHRLMEAAIRGEPDTAHLADEFNKARLLYAVGVGDGEFISGTSLDPWYVLEAHGTIPMAVWTAHPNPLKAPTVPPKGATIATMAEFITGISPELVVRCTHHG